MKTKSDYVSIVYDEKRTPRTGYPFELAGYLFNRFNLEKGQKLLEIGCGRGEFLEAFDELGLDCCGLDHPEYGLSNFAGMKIQKADVAREKLPYDNDTFDVVYHKSLIEHIYNPDNLMKETRRVLKSGGKLIILAPDWRSQMKVFYEDFTHSRPYDMTSLRDLLRVHGFEEVYTEKFCQLPVLWRYPVLKIAGRFLRVFIPVTMARKITNLTGIKFFRWSVELMVLGSGVKKG